ncbi:MAG: hypothetical protein Kow0099_24550 [Candidatus Abyssubacteria bacterium]
MQPLAARVTRYLKETLIILSCGIAFGVAFHIYKFEAGGDTFWNVRLLLISLVGVLLFPVVRYFDARLIRLTARNYDTTAHRETSIANLPLLLVLLYPLQRKATYEVWPKPLFLQYLAFVVGLLVLFKIIAAVNARKRAGRTPGPPQHALPGSPRLCVVSTVLAVSLFWVHQYTRVFDSFYRILTDGNPGNHYIFDKYITREGCISPSVNRSDEIPSGHINLTVGCKVMEKSTKALAKFSAIPLAVTLRVTDEDKNILHEEHAIIDASRNDAAVWHDFNLELPRFKGGTLDFLMDARPLLSKIDRAFLRDILFHNPVDFSHWSGMVVKFAWSKPEISEILEERPNVFLISIDTLRPDRLSCYGYPKRISSAIDSLADVGILYENAFSQSTWTLPSHLSMLTSMFPNELHLATGGIDETFDRVHESGILTNPHTTLAQTLRNERYYCIGFTDGCYVSSFYGFYKGFHLYDERYGDTCNSFQLAEQWLDENPKKKCFLFIHTYLVHEYALGDEQLTQDNRRVGPPKKGAEDCGLAPPSMQEIKVAYPDYETLDAYDKRIAMLDVFVRDFISYLKEKGLFENSLIVFTSDHGESFGELHNDGKTGIMWHMQPPYESQIRIPLIVKFPASARVSVPTRISENVRLVDVAPTILAVLGLDIPEQFRGQPLPPVAHEPRTPYDFVYATGRTPSVGCIRDGNLKYIDNQSSEEFYDLQKDPMELHNLADSQPPEMLRIKEEYLEFREEVGRKGISPEDTTEVAPAQIREQLKALGYLE